MDRDAPAKKSAAKEYLASLLTEEYYDNRRKTQPSYDKQYQMVQDRKREMSGLRFVAGGGSQLTQNDNPVRTLIDNHLYENPKYYGGFLVAPFLKWPIDCFAGFLISRSIRRAMYVYEAGLFGASIFALCSAGPAVFIRKDWITDSLLYGNLRCYDVCPIVRGLITDVCCIGGLNIVIFLTLTMFQADRYKSAEIPAVSRFKITRSQLSFIKGTLGSAWRGGGLKSALALGILPGVVLSYITGQSAKDFWKTLPIDKLEEAADIEKSQVLARLKSGLQRF